MTQTAAPALDASAVRTLALDYNRAYLVRAARFESFDVAAVEAQICAGDVVVIYGQANTHGGRTIVWAAPVVKMPESSTLGEYAHIGDVIESTVRLPKGMPSHKAGEWWVRKQFGTSLPIEFVNDVR